jgi:hypothetical protein
MLPTWGQVITQLAQIYSFFPLESAGTHLHSINPNPLLLSADLLLLPTDWPLLSAPKHMNVKTEKLN